MNKRRSILATSVFLFACGANPPLTVPPPTTATPPPLAPPASSAKPSSALDTVRALQGAALASTGAYETVAALSKEVGGRLAGGPKDKVAVEWALHALAAKTAFSSVHAEAARVPHWERGIERAELLLPGHPAEALAMTALGGSSATPASGVEGQVILLDSLDALEKLDARAAAGKIVFIDHKMKRSRDGSGYGEAVRTRFAAPLAAKAKGAVAVLIRSVGTDDLAPHTGATRTEIGVKGGSSIAPAGALSGADADKLHRAIDEKKAVRVRVVLTPKWFPEADSSNVVADVPGREKKDEFVLLGAHLDSWDLGQGALDDGAGCAIVIEAARLIAELPVKPRRTVRVVLFASEEQGIAGAKTYAEAHASEAGRYVLALEADAGTDKVITARFTGAADKRPRFDELAALLAPLGIAAESEEAFGGADISPLRRLGVPAVDLEQDFSTYFDLHHTANDTLEHVNKEGLAQAAAAFATVAWWAAEMDGDFGRVPEDKRAPKF